MSDEYKDRYIIIALLKTPLLYYTDNGEHHVSSLTELNKRGGSSSDIIKDLPNT